MKLLMQMCVLMFFFFATWGVADILKLILDQLKVRFSGLISAGLSLVVVCALLTGMLWGATSG